MIKYSAVRCKNPGAQFLSEIGQFFQGKDNTDLLNKYTVTEICALKYVPITSCDVEWVFSMYSSFMRDSRQSFLEENIEKYLMIYVNLNF